MLKNRCTYRLWYWQFVSNVDGVATYAAPRIIRVFVHRDVKGQYSLDKTTSQSNVRIASPTKLIENSYVKTFEYAPGGPPASPIGVVGTSQISGVSWDFSMDERQRLYVATVASWV
jgi:hypothetical protein